MRNELEEPDKDLVIAKMSRFQQLGGVYQSLAPAPCPDRSLTARGANR
jgi:hypothetical protein